MGNTKKLKGSKKLNKPNINSQKVNPVIDAEIKQRNIKDKNKLAYQKRIQAKAKPINKVKKIVKVKPELIKSTDEKAIDNIAIKPIAKVEKKIAKELVKETKTKKRKFEYNFKKMFTWFHISEKTKKILLIVIPTLVLIVIGFIMALNYNSHKISNNYQEYILGDKVKIDDNGIWYVVEDSLRDDENVLLLSEKPIDINMDGKIDAKDKISFSRSDKIIYNYIEEDNIAFYIDKYYQSKFKDIKEIENVRLLTSKEYVRIRNKMNFGYEWSEGNWLASKSLGTWWINAAQNEKMYVVNNKGSYLLVSPSKKHYVRIVIKIEKSKVNKIVN